MNYNFWTTILVFACYYLGLSRAACVKLPRFNEGLNKNVFYTFSNELGNSHLQSDGVPTAYSFSAQKQRSEIDAASHQNSVCFFSNGTKSRKHVIAGGVLVDVKTAEQCSYFCEKELRGKSKYFSYQQASKKCYCENGRASNDKFSDPTYTFGPVGCSTRSEVPVINDGQVGNESIDTKDELPNEKHKSTKEGKNASEEPVEEPSDESDDEQVAPLKKASAGSKMFSKTKSFLKSPFTWIRHGSRKMFRSMGAAKVFNIHMHGNKQTYYLKDWSVQDSANNKYLYRSSGRIATAKVQMQKPSILFLQFDADAPFCKPGIDAFSPEKVYLRVFKTSQPNAKCNEVEGIKICVFPPISLKRKGPLDDAKLDQFIMDDACTKLPLTEKTHTFDSFSIGKIFRPEITRSYPNFDKLTLMLRAEGTNCEFAIDPGKNSADAHTPMLSWGEHTGSSLEKEELGITTKSPFDSIKWIKLEPQEKMTVNGKKQSTVNSGENVDLKYNLPEGGLAAKNVGIEFMFEGKYLDGTKIEFITKQGKHIFTVVPEFKMFGRNNLKVQTELKSSTTENNFVNKKEFKDLPISKNQSGSIVVQHSGGKFWVAAKRGSTTFKYDEWNIFSNGWTENDKALEETSEVRFSGVGWPASIQGRMLKTGTAGQMPTF